MNKHLPLTGVLFLFIGIKIFAKNYYVSAANGNDANNGLTLGLAKKTIQAAANLTAAGDTVFVANGVYTTSSSSILNVPNSGTASAWIVYINYPGHAPKIKMGATHWNAINITKNYIKIIGFEIEGNNLNVTLTQALNQPGGCVNSSGGSDPRYNGNGITMDGRAGSVHNHHHEILKNSVHDCGGGGISTLQTDYTTIEDNVIYNNSWYTIYGTSGISLLSSYNTDSNTGYRNFIRRNKCYNNRLYVPWVSAPCKITDGNGIIVDSNNDFSYTGKTLIENNICWFNGGSGIHAFASKYVDIINNTAYRNSQSIQTTGGQVFPNHADYIKIINNIIVTDSSNAINSNSTNTNITYLNNLHYNVTSPNTITAPLTNTTCVIGKDPLFISAGNNLTANFHLQSTSPAINVGNATTYSPKDFDGNTRPQGSKAEIGAYEYLISTEINLMEEHFSSLKIYPNPASETLLISYVLGINSQIKISVYDLLGKEVLQVLNEKKIEGEHQLNVNTEQLPNGIYFVKMNTTVGQTINKLIINK